MSPSASLPYAEPLPTTDESLHQVGTMSGTIDDVRSGVPLAKGRVRPPRRPDVSQFNSLQEMLEEAGYKETRIFTPQSTIAKGRSVSGASTSTEGAVPSDGLSGQKQIKEAGPLKDEAVKQAKDAAASSSWFNVPWTQQPNGRSARQSQQPRAIAKKTSEPAIARKSSMSRLFGWTRGALSDEASTASAQPVVLSQREAGESDAANTSAANAGTATKGDMANSQQPTLRRADSTHQLWQASMRHHRAALEKRPDEKRLVKSRSFPAKMASDDARPTISGAKFVGAVGMLLSKDADSPPDGLFLRHSRSRRGGLRQTYQADAEADSDLDDRAEEGAEPVSELKANDTVCNIIDIYASDSRKSLAELAVQASPEKPPPVPSLPASEAAHSVLLYATMAQPLLSRSDAVAMRNGDCLDFVPVSGPRASPESKANSEAAHRPSIRRMRSVDALELALRRMDTLALHSQEAPSPLQGIPESNSNESLHQEDFDNAKTTSIDFSGLGDDSLHVLNTLQDPEHPERAATPTLVITSPTGSHPPQPLLLDGVEFEPRSVSPHAKGTSILYQPKKKSGWIMTENGFAPENVISGEGRGRSLSSTAKSSDMGRPSRSLSRRRKSKVSSCDPRQRSGEARLGAPKLRRRAGATQSHGDLRGYASTPTASVEMDRELPPVGSGRTSGSQNVHLLHRNVLQREKQHATAVPRSPTMDDPNDEDPFNDFVHDVKSHPRRTPDAKSIFSDESSMDLAVKQASRRPPLGEKTSAVNTSSVDSYFEVPASEKASVKPRSSHSTKTLAKKSSGVGLACLVDVNSSLQTLRRHGNASDPPRRHGKHATRNSLASLSSASSIEALSLEGEVKRTSRVSARTRPIPSSLAQPASHSKDVPNTASSSISTMQHLDNDSDAENRNPQIFDSPTARAGQRILKKRSSRSAMPSRTAGDAVRRM